MRHILKVNVRCLCRVDCAKFLDFLRVIRDSDFIVPHAYLFL